MRRRGRLLLVAVVVVPLSGCAYYNAMWSAERLARDARRQEATGLAGEARLSWGRAAAKAESVLTRHPESRWADDALVLQGEGLARSGACGEAAAPLRRALHDVVEEALRERAALAAAECALEQDRPASVARLLTPVLQSHDGQRRSDAAYLMGRAAAEHLDPAAAAALFAQSTVPAAGPARIRSLAAAGELDRAVALVDTVAQRVRDEADWSLTLAALGTTAGAGTAGDALDRLLARGRLRPGARARLLIADGDRLRAARLLDRAAARYAAAVKLVPDSTEAGSARVRALLVRAAYARRPEDLDSIAASLMPLTGGSAGLLSTETQGLSRQIDAIRGAESEMDAFRAAEVARDSLAAPVLAAELFQRFAERFPASLFAPKALIAVGALRPEALDSVNAALEAGYAGSPYTLAFRGAISPAFQVVEDSLAIALGVAQPRALTEVAPFQIAPPRPGARGPDLEPAITEVLDHAGRRPGVTPGERPARPRRPGEKPPVRPQDRP